MYLIRWYLSSFQGYGRLALLTPFLSSIGSSPSKRNLFLAIWLSRLSSFLQGTPRGNVVILLMSSGVISMERPLTTTVAWVLVSGMRERAKSQATSSSYPLNFSKYPIQLYLVMIYNTRGCWWILTVLMGSLLLNPPVILSSECWGAEMVDTNFNAKGNVT